MRSELGNGRVRQVQHTEAKTTGRKGWRSSLVSRSIVLTDRIAFIWPSTIQWPEVLVAMLAPRLDPWMLHYPQLVTSHGTNGPLPGYFPPCFLFSISCIYTRKEDVILLWRHTCMPTHVHTRSPETENVICKPHASFKR